MNVRTGEIAHDVAWARPPAIPGALINVYNGAARPTKEQVDAWGKPVLMGFESATTRSYAAGDAGEADAAFSCTSFDEVGYPRECGSWICAADANSTPPQFLANITDYGRRYALRMIVGGRSGPILAYGNPDAVEAMCAGIRDAGLVALRWGVGTWGYGEGGGPNQPPAEADAELVQSGNTPGQAEGTDLNWLYAPVSIFAAWGGPTVTPTNPYLMEDSMDFFATDPANRGSIWWFSAAGRRHVVPDEWGIIEADAALKGLTPPKPFAATPEMFREAPDVTTYAGGGAGAAHFTGTVDIHATP